MNYKFKWILILCLVCSCASNKGRMNTLSRSELVKKGSESRHKYMGEKELLTDVQNVAEELLKRNPDDYNGLLLKSWLIMREGYYNSDAGFDSNNLEHSYKLITKAISLRPNDWKGWKELTFLFINAKRPSQAKKFASKFRKLRVSPNDKKYLHDKTLVDMQIFYLDEKYDDVLTLSKNCEKYSTDKYDKKQCLNLEALTYSKLGNYENQVEARKKIFSMFPTNAWTNGNLAGAYSNLKDFPAAIKYYEEAIKIRRYGLALADLGSLYAVMARRRLSEGKKNEALSFMDKLFELGVHGESTGLFASSVAKKNFKDENLREKVLIDGIKNVPDSGRLRVELGTLYRNQKNYKKALETYDQLFFGEGWSYLGIENKVFVANQIAWINLWGLEDKNYDRAVEALEKVEDVAMQSKEFKGRYIFYLASAFHEKSWFEKSISLSNKALELYDQALMLNPAKQESIQKNIKNVQANIRNFKN